MSWDKAHCTWDGDDWAFDCTKEALKHVVSVLVNNGYTVGIDKDFAGALN
jgi:hypothetical protein